MPLGFRNFQFGLKNESTSRGTLQVGAHNESVYSGAQLGLVNTSDFDGVQLGVYNYANVLKGIQIGLVCDTEYYYSRYSDSYVQIGLLTLRRHAPWYLSASPLIGWHK